MRSNEDVLKSIARGESLEFLFFWGHHASKDGSISKSCFSQWFDAPFQYQGKTFPTAEHFMMVRKAELFHDTATRDAILESPDPGKAKALGREVKGFDESVWLDYRWRIVVQANMFKFGENERLRDFLLATGEKVLVEASPVDTIWGIGLASESAEAHDPAQWKGLNLLEFALMEVRDRLRTS